MSKETIFTGRGMAAFHKKVMSVLMQQVVEPLGAATISSTPPADGLPRPAAEPAVKQRSRRRSSLAENPVVAALRSRGGYTEKHEADSGSRRMSKEYMSSSEQEGRNPRRSAPAVVPFLPLSRANSERCSTASARGHDPHGSPTMAENSQALVDQFNEFLHRGTPRASSGSFPAVVSSKHLEHEVGAWVASRGVNEEDLWFSSLRAKPHVYVHPSVPAQEAILVVCGVELILDVAVTVPSPNHAGYHRVNIVTGARSPCPWPTAQRCVLQAVRTACPRPVEDFLDALWAAFARAEVVVDHATSRRQSGVAHRSKSAQSSLGAAEGASPSHRRRRSSTTDSDGHHAVHTPTALQQQPEAESPQVMAQQECDGDCGSAEDAFIKWFTERRGCFAWDFPQSKAEKRELLFLHLIAEGREQQLENQALKRKTAQSAFSFSEFSESEAPPVGCLEAA